MVFSDGLARVVLVGGFTGTRRNDTWTYGPSAVPTLSAAGLALLLALSMIVGVYVFSRLSRYRVVYARRMLGDSPARCSG